MSCLGGEVSNVAPDNPIGPKLTGTPCHRCCPVDAIYEIDGNIAFIGDDCVNCGACIPECPLGAIIEDFSRPFVDKNICMINCR